MQISKNFHSYLFIGAKQPERLAAIDDLCSNLGVKIQTNSPDFTIIEPAKNTIGIAEVRELKKTIFQKPQVQPFNVVLIKNADTLTIEAQNSLLKLIEEPPQLAITILEADTKGTFLPTVLSRIATRIVKPQSKKEDTTPESFDTDLQSTLMRVLEIENPKEWINNQIESHYSNLLKNPQSSISQIQIIEKLAQTKKMISANINPKFSLTSLVLDITKS